MTRVVLDTSVLVSAVISPQGPNARLFDLITADEIMPCVSDALLDEYHRELAGHQALEGFQT